MSLVKDKNRAICVRVHLGIGHKFHIADAIRGKIAFDLSNQISALRNINDAGNLRRKLADNAAQNKRLACSSLIGQQEHGLAIVKRSNSHANIFNLLIDNGLWNAKLHAIGYEVFCSLVDQFGIIRGSLVSASILSVP